ncbi:ABC transporter substrate-binding protein [Chitinophaga japonensis]|uniref:Branched-chain amino acid transport system substrate-binding protein n=1 Tax=Chitinophaga japonensis TaxID=104662 RepID=A0A562T033_CHIJA|nr:ABC transporter substrate-binding protein [Chitinophaga japonensis]TWI86713.1 branched-chain amino acid transport system substrate-binding protein [Chitinophaga japonensis]
MSPSFTVGFLTPYSGIYPYYAQHLFTGWLLGMGLDPARQNTVQFIQEYTEMGGMSASEAAARKLLFFNRVDILSGLISYKAVPGLIPLVEKERRPAFFFDMGEYVPHFPYLSPDVFYASHQLWQSQYALGRWAESTFGSGGHMIMPIYEAGYHLNSTFQQGAASAGAQELKLTVLPFDEKDPYRMELGNFFTELAKEPPTYVHAIFCGSMGARFFRQWIASGFHKKIPLLVHETMAYDDILDDIKHVGLEIYTSQLWMREDENKINQLFVKTFESVAQQPANIYALMGYEAGMIWREVLPHAQKKDWDTVKQQLRTGVINGPRGEKNFYPASGFALPNPSIIKVTTSNNKIHKIILDQGKGMRFDAKELEVIHNESTSGWQNPFLCI